jgi:hypothetical protein
MKFAALIAAFMLLSACLVSRTPGYQSGYRYLSEEQKAKIHFADTTGNCCQYSSHDSIYAVNGMQLYRCIRNTMKAMVYIWSPHCHSTSCYSIKAVQDYCSNHGYTLFVIAEYYDDALFGSAAAFPQDRPIYSINEKYYKTTRCNRYYKLFVKELLSGQSFSKEDLFSNFFLFENGVLKSVRLKL